MQSNLSYEEYVSWCKSRFPPLDPGDPPDSYASTVPASGEEPCPVTVRSRQDNVQVTPKSKGSR